MRGVGYLFRAELVETAETVMKLRVQSIFTKIVVWAVATVFISLVGFVVDVGCRFGPDFPGENRLAAVGCDVRWKMPAAAFEEGGPRRLDAFLKRLNDYNDTEYFLTDGRGIDLVSGEDRSALRSSVRQAYRSPLVACSCPAPRRSSGFAARATVNFA